MMVIVIMLQMSGLMSSRVGHTKYENIFWGFKVVTITYLIKYHKIIYFIYNSKRNMLVHVKEM